MKRLIIGTAVLLLSSFTLMLSSQTINEAGEVYNEGIKLKDTDVNAAIIKFNDCIKICEQIGDEGLGLRIKSENALPELYYKSAMAIYKSKKFEEALKAFELSKEMADKYDNEKYSQKSHKYMSIVYVNLGNKYFKTDIDKALENYNKAIELDSNSLKAHYKKAKVYIKKNEEEKFKEEIDKVIKIGPEKSKVVVNAKTMAIRYYQNLGKKSINVKKYDEGIKYLNTALAYGENAETYFIFAVCYNAQKKWHEATEATNKALELVTDDKMKAQINAEIEKTKKGMEAK